MSQSVSHELEADARTARRAINESYAFAVPCPGKVNVANHSHADPKQHTYTVTVEDGTPTRCTCPADENYSGPCKHALAVAAMDAVMLAADDRDDDECDDCTAAWPCWDCVNSGRRELPE